MKIDWSNIISIKDIVNLILGSIIAIIISYFFYTSASKGLLKETEILKGLNTMLINIMEDNGWVQVNRDAEGKPVGRIVPMSGKSEIGVTSSGNADVKKNEQ